MRIRSIRVRDFRKLTGPVCIDRIGDGITVNPSGGPLAGHPVMATGLIRVIEVANRIQAGSASRGVAHASSGPCLQQNLVCVMDGGG